MEILVANSTMVTKVEFGSNDDPADIANLFVSTKYVNKRVL